MRQKRTLSDRPALPVHRPPVDVALQATTRRIRQPSLHLPLAQVLQRAGNTSESSAGTGRADEGLQAAGEETGLLPDFGTGGVDVGGAVAFVVAEIGEEGS
jgi:hypothetical protein